MQPVVVWSSWIGGAAIGLYVLLQYWISGNALGASTGYGNLCALASKSSFFKSGKFVDAKNWRLWFTLGLPLGGLIAALTSPGAFTPTLSMGQMYDSVMPSSWIARGAVLIVGGMMIGFGARMAGGCTSGHSIVGGAMLNPPSLLASAGFFIGGIIAVQLLFNLV